MHRRHLLIAGGSMFALSACASNGMSMGGGTSPATLAADAAAARAVLPAQTPRAELLQVWTGPYGGVPPWDRVTAPKLRAALLAGIDVERAEIEAIANKASRRPSRTPSSPCRWPATRGTGPGGCTG